MFCVYSEMCKTELDRRFVEDGGLLKCGSPATATDKNEPLQINEDAKALWLKFKFVQFAAKWVEGQRSMKRRRMNEASGMQVGAKMAPSLITMPSVVRNIFNKPCLFTIYYLHSHVLM
jgi:hypothetical protein